ncbi:hypothetical protein [Amycolatopsis vancoresmycina]|uniref:hypothetical protein n=1 Tax=Amycolatopsis vancoresmycina TaxID=208444 RepID=UPI000525B934|nr:hypothetical protein [Amycolatopsis vancoresmycina]
MRRTPPPETPYTALAKHIVASNARTVRAASLLFAGSACLAALALVYFATGGVPFAATCCSVAGLAAIGRRRRRR